MGLEGRSESLILIACMLSAKQFCDCLPVSEYHPSEHENHGTWNHGGGGDECDLRLCLSGGTANLLRSFSPNLFDNLSECVADRGSQLFGLEKCRHKIINVIGAAAVLGRGEGIAS